MKFTKLRYILALWCFAPEASAFTTKRVIHHRVSGAPTTSTSLNLEKLEQKTPDDREVLRLLDNYGEKARKYRRQVFTAADWVRTRRPDRFIDNFTTTLNSGLVRNISAQLTFVCAAATFIVMYNEIFVDGFDFAGSHFDPLLPFLPLMKAPMQPFQLSISALGLLLAFRTNTCYARWNEARTAWGKVINDSRSIMRMGCTWARSYKNIDDYQLQRLGDTVCSFSRSLMNRTLPPQEDEENFKLYLRERMSDRDYAERLIAAKHRPTAALAEITQILVEWDLNPLHQVEVEKVITGLCDALGASERIFTSPVPTFYTRHTARFLAFWLTTLPLALYEPFAYSWNHWAVVPATLIISGFLLGIEELATQMEEPFSILPMEKMCEGSIRTPVMEQVERSQMAGVGVPLYDVAEAPAVPVVTEAPAAVEEQFFQEPFATVQEQYYEPPAAPTQEDLNAQWARQSGSQNW